MRELLLEEVFEAIAAIDADDDTNLREELGDVLLTVAMLARMKEQENSFSISEVLTDVVDKLRRRHPHVFPPETEPDSTPVNNYPMDADAVVRQWEQIKQNERSSGEEPASTLTSVKSSPSPLRRAFYLQKTAGSVGFDWDDIRPVFAKVAEELTEVDEASTLGVQRTEEELGDLLFAVVNLARHLSVDPLLALNGANERFRRRFQEVERRVREKGDTLGKVPLADLDRHWEAVKRGENRTVAAPDLNNDSSIPTAIRPAHNADPP